MKLKINSKEGRLVNFTITFEDGSERTKTMDLQPVGFDDVDEDGKPIIVFVDPLDDLVGYLKEYTKNLWDGLQKEKSDKQKESESDSFTGQEFSF